MKEKNQIELENRELNKGETKMSKLVKEDGKWLVKEEELNEAKK